MLVLIRKLYLQVMDIIFKRKCYACGKKSEKNGSELREYRCDYYPVRPNRYNKRAYGVYIEHPDDTGTEYHVMLCRSCYIKNRNVIEISVHLIPKDQYKKWVRQVLKK